MSAYLARSDCENQTKLLSSSENDVPSSQVDCVHITRKYVCLCGFFLWFINTLTCCMVVFVSLLLLKEKYFGNNGQATLPLPNVGASAGADNRFGYPGAHLYIDIPELDKGQVSWSTAAREAYTANVEFVKNGAYQCLKPGVPGLYHVYCQVTYRYDRCSSIPGSRFYQMLIKRTPNGTETLAKNTETVTEKAFRPETGYIYQPSFIQGYFYINSTDSVCAHISDIELLYRSNKESYFGLSFERFMDL